MLKLLLNCDRRRVLNVLAIGAHCDDIEIGCGGTLQVLQSSFPRLCISCLTLVAPPNRRLESEAALKALIRPRARGTLTYHDLRDGYLPDCYAAAKEAVEAQRRAVKPDLILCHERDDRHQDHRVLSEIAWSTFRSELILEYEVAKWDGGLGTPNLYVPLTEAQVRRKHTTLLQTHGSQTHRDWFNARSFEALLRLRGLECRSPSGLAEGFYARKLTLASGP